MKQNFILPLLVVVSCFFFAGCEKEKDPAQAKNEKIDEWIKRGGQKGPIQRPLKTGKPYKYADEESNEDSNKK